jgi:hypothetical protein
MMMEEPGPFIEAYHREMAQNPILFLIDEMTGHFIALPVELLEALTDLLLVLTQHGILVRVDEARIKEEAPKSLQIDRFAETAVLVIGLVDQGEEHQMFLGIDIDDAESVVDLSALLLHPTLDNLGPD